MPVYVYIFKSLFKFEFDNILFYITEAINFEYKIMINVLL